MAAEPEKTIQLTETQLNELMASVIQNSMEPNIKACLKVAALIFSKYADTLEKAQINVTPSIAFEAAKLAIKAATDEARRLAKELETKADSA